MNQKKIRGPQSASTPVQVPASRFRWPAGGLLAAIGLLYIKTLSPGLPPTDSGELILAAWLPGVAHAPGFPLYTMLGWLWTHLALVGRVAWRLNLLSALCSVVAVGLTYGLVLRTLSGIGKNTHPDQTFGTKHLIGAAALGATGLALGRTVWSWSTVAEVYALNLALSAAILALLVRWADDLPLTGKSHPKSWPLALAGWLFGIGLGGHLTSIAILAPAIAYWLVVNAGWRLWQRRDARWALLALCTGAAVYVYLPLRAAADPLLNWGNPDTWQRFWWHLTAKQYRVSLLASPVWPQVLYAAKLWWWQFTPLGLGLLGLGARHMFHRRRPLFWVLLLIVVVTILYAWAYIIEDDQDAYYLPAFLAGAIWVGWGGFALWGWLTARIQTPTMRRYAPLSLLLAPLIALAVNWGACDRHADTIPEDYVRDAFAEIGANGLLLTRDWQLYSPALYLQGGEGLRPDLTVIDTELMRRRWYFDLLHRVDPGLMAAVTTEEAGFLVLRDAWERGDIPDQDPRIGQLQAAYVALLDALIDTALAGGRPVHVGPNRGAEPLRMVTLQGQPDIEPGVGSAWGWLPVGLTFQAWAPETTPAPPAPLSWSVAAFDRVTLSAPERKIQATRADMATLRGLYQANAGALAGAEADWRLALAIDPSHKPAAEFLKRLQTAP